MSARQIQDHTKLELRIRRAILRDYGLNYGDAIDAAFYMQKKGWADMRVTGLDTQVFTFNAITKRINDNHFMICLNEFFLYNKQLLELYEL